MLAGLATVRAATPWYNNSWYYRMAVTISHTNVTGTLTNFPVLINITNSALQQYAQTNGNDILFTSASGTNKLAHEIESYTGSNGLLVAWVNVPSLSSAADTNIYLYYGNASATNQQNVAATWDSNFKGVWHMNNSLTDSTSNGNNGSNTLTVNTAGKISNGRAFIRSNGIAFITISGLMGSSSNLTLSAWINLNSLDTAGAEFISLGDHAGVRQDNTGIVGDFYNGTAWFTTPSSTNFVGMGWRHVAYTVDSGGHSQLLYVDGAQIAASSYTNVSSYSGLGSNTIIGKHGNGATGYSFDGAMDEVRVSSTPRSAGWIATERKNQNSPAAFFSLAGPESVLATALAVTSVNGGTSPTYGTAFSVVVQAQNAGGTAANVASNTTVTLSLNTGTGTLGGTLTGTITNGTSSITFSGITYSQAQSGLILTATRTSGDSLTAGNSSSFTVNPAPATVSSGLAANNKVYDGTTAATISSNAVALSGVMAGDAANVKLSTNGYTATFASAGVGSAIGVTVSGLTLTGSSAANYALTQPSLNATITVATVTIASGITANNKVYDGTTTAAISSNSVVLSGVAAGDTANAKLSTNGYAANFAGTAVGSGIGVTVGGLTLTGSAAANYALTQPALAANVTAKSLTVTGATASNKVYDATTLATVSTNGAALVGVVGGDTVILTGTATGSFATKAVANGKTVTISGLVISGASSGNYALAQPTATANITAATLTVTGVTANNKVYDGTTSATLNTAGAALVGVISGDTVALNAAGATGTFDNANPGTSKTVTVSGLTLSGTDAGNYSLTQPTTTAAITAAIVITTSIHWSQITTGSGPGGQPSSGDTITVYGGATLTVDVTNGVCASIQLSSSAGSGMNGPGFLAFNSGSQTTVSGAVNLGSSGDQTGGTFGEVTMTNGATLICQSLVVYPNSTSPSVWVPGSGTVQLAATGTLPSIVITNFNNLILPTGVTTLAAALTVTNLTQSGGNIALVANPLTIISSHYAGTNTVSGTGSYTNLAGFFESASTSGIAGNLTTTGTKALGAESFLFDGAAAQVTSTNLPAIVSGLTISNAAGATLSQNTTTTNLTLAKGNLVTAGYQLTLANTNNTAISGAGSTSYVVGALQKYFGSGTSQSFAFPIGTATAYSPVTLSSLNLGGSGSRSITLQSTDGDHPQLGTSGIATNQSVNRYWTLTQSGSTFTNYSLTFNYLTNDLDAAASPGSFIVQIYTNSAWGSVPTVGTPTSTSTVVTNYTAGSASFAIGDPMSNQTITFPTPGNQTYGAGPIALTATASSGLTVTYTASGPATVTNGSLYIHGAGTVSIIAAQSGNGSFNAATPVTNTILVSPKAIAISSGLSANNKVYDGTAAATLSSNNVVLSGVLAGDSGFVSLSTNGWLATFASPIVGTGIGVTVSGLTLTGSAATNYTLAQPALSASISSVPLTVTANSTNRVYGAANPSFTATYSGFVNGDTAAVVQGAPGFSTAATSLSPVGGYAITPLPGSLAATNYSFTTFSNGTLTVTKAGSANSVSSSANPSPTGSNLTFTAALTAVSPGSGTPTGTVQFLADGAALGSPAPLSGGVASLVVNSLSHGTHVITAQYAGDGNFIGSTNTLSPNQLIDTAPTAAIDTLQRYPTSNAKQRLTVLLANASDPDGDSVTLSSISASTVQGGTVLSTNSWVFYTPPAGFTNSDGFSYVVTDGSLLATGAVAVAIVADLNPSQNIELTQTLGNGSVLTRFMGIPGRTYTIQCATNLVAPAWLSLGTAAADPSGLLAFTDSPPTNSPPRFYRSTYP